MKRDRGSNKQNNRNNNSGNVKREQPKKDSKVKRINMDNVREDKLAKDVIKDIGKTCASNDVRWYANNPELLRSAATLPFSQTTGQRLAWKGLQTTDVASRVPGVMQLGIVPTLGGWDDDAVQAAKESIYSFVVHANSRNTSYGPNDLMLVILAGSQVFAMLANAIRAYGTMRVFDQRNKYLPIGLIRAMGFDYSDLQLNLSRMWFDINELIARVSQIWIPNTMPFLDRWFWINSNIYQDSASIKGQFYIMVNTGFWIYNETYDDQGGGLNWVTVEGKPATDNSNSRYNPAYNAYTWSQYMTVINGMIDALLNSEDRGVIMGDILKAYGADKIYALKPIPVDYQVVPQYDTEVMTQIENCDQYNSVYYGIHQNQTTLRIDTDWGAPTAGKDLTNRCVPSQAILNFHQKEVPSPEQIMVATRLKALGSKGFYSSDGKLNTVVPETMGTEYVWAVNVYTFDNSGITSFWYNMHSYFSSANIQFAALAFDWAPWIYDLTTAPVVNGQAQSVTISCEVRRAMGDYDNYTVIDAQTLKKMHTTALYSEFGVPVI